jgi:hypothetical protein
MTVDKSIVDGRKQAAYEISIKVSPLNHQLVNIRGQARPTCHPSGAFVVDSKLAGTTGKEGDTFSRISFGLRKG